MLDTSVAIYLRDGHDEVTQRLRSLEGEPIISAITRVELESGVYRDPSQVERRRNRLDQMLEIFTVLPFDGRAAAAYGQILAVLGFSRSRIIDRMIAAHAISTGLSLITANGADFRGIPGLRLADWPS
jgi:tRNA(fMet)-specific endonuclease VapC